MVDGNGGFDDLDYDEEYAEFEAEGRFEPDRPEVYFGVDCDAGPVDPLR